MEQFFLFKRFSKQFFGRVLNWLRIGGLKSLPENPRPVFQGTQIYVAVLLYRRRNTIDTGSSQRGRLRDVQSQSLTVQPVQPTFLARSFDCPSKKLQGLMNNFSVTFHNFSVFWHSTVFFLTSK